MVAGYSGGTSVLEVVWQFHTRPDHSRLLAGPTGHVIGLAATGRHGELDRAGHRRDPARAERLEPCQRVLVNGYCLWIVVTIVSGILSLGCAKVGSRSDLEAPGRWWEH
jgi:hypothetical protein